MAQQRSRSGVEVKLAVTLRKMTGTVTSPLNAAADIPDKRIVVVKTAFMANTGLTLGWLLGSLLGSKLGIVDGWLLG